MTIKIGNHVFDHVLYDSEADVLYLHKGDPRTAVEFDGSPEGHALRFDAAGKLVGITIVSARAILDESGEIVVTVPPQLTIMPDTLRPALAVAA